MISDNSKKIQGIMRRLDKYKPDAAYKLAYRKRTLGEGCIMSHLLFLIRHYSYHVKALRKQDKESVNKLYKDIKAEGISLGLPLIIADDAYEKVTDKNGTQYDEGIAIIEAEIAKKNRFAIQHMIGFYKKFQLRDRYFDLDKIYELYCLLEEQQPLNKYELIFKNAINSLLNEPWKAELAAGKYEHLIDVADAIHDLYNEHPEEKTDNAYCDYLEIPLMRLYAVAGEHQKDPEVCFRIGYFIYGSGDSKKTSPDEYSYLRYLSMNVLEKAAKKGHAEAAYYLATCHEMGINEFAFGTKDYVDLKQALYWYKKAFENGYKEAEDKANELSKKIR